MKKECFFGGQGASLRDSPFTGPFQSLKFEVFSAVTMDIIVFQAVLQCSAAIISTEISSIFLCMMFILNATSCLVRSTLQSSLLSTWNRSRVLLLRCLAVACSCNERSEKGHWNRISFVTSFFFYIMRFLFILESHAPNSQHRFPC
jgi:hypothetical protein